MAHMLFLLALRALMGVAALSPFAAPTHAALPPSEWHDDDISAEDDDADSDADDADGGESDDGDGGEV